jgi:azobenzene reductase
MTPRVLLISGSVAPTAHTRMLVLTVAAALRLGGVQPDLLDLRATPLPIADPAYHEAPERHPDPVIRDLAQRASAAGGFVLGSPVYHNSYSGVLKNCLDHLGIRQFAGKPVALVAHGGGIRNFQPCDHLRIVVRGMHGNAIVPQVVTTDADYAQQSGRHVIVERAVLRRITDLAEHLCQQIHLMRELDARSRPANNGGVAAPGRRGVPTKTGPDRDQSVATTRGGEHIV